MPDEPLPPHPHTEEHPTGGPKPGGHLTTQPTADSADQCHCICYFEWAFTRHPVATVDKTPDNDPGCRDTGWRKWIFLDVPDARFRAETAEGMGGYPNKAVAADVGYLEVALVHKNPCQNCIGKAEFHATAVTTIVDSVRATPATCQSASASATGSAVVTGDLGYAVRGLVTTKTEEEAKKDPELELEAEIEVPGKGKVRIKWRPKFSHGDYDAQPELGQDTKDVIGDQMRWKIDISGKAVAVGDKDSPAVAKVTIQTQQAFVMICKCKCPGHPRTRGGHLPQMSTEAFEMERNLRKLYL